MQKSIREIMMKFKSNVNDSSNQIPIYVLIRKLIVFVKSMPDNIKRIHARYDDDPNTVPMYGHYAVQLIFLSPLVFTLLIYLTSKIPEDQFPIAPLFPYIIIIFVVILGLLIFTAD